MIGQFLCAITGVWIPILGSVFSCWEEWIHSATNSKSRLSPSFVERRWEACEAEAHTALYGSLRGVTGLRESLPCPQFQTAGGRAGGSSNQEFKQMIRHPQPRTTDGAQACNDVQSGACRSLPFPCPLSSIHSTASYPRALCMRVHLPRRVHDAKRGLLLRPCRTAALLRCTLLRGALRAHAEAFFWMHLWEMKKKASMIAASALSLSILLRQRQS